jgi:hypothetical protein
MTNHDFYGSKSEIIMFWTFVKLSDWQGLTTEYQPYPLRLGLRSRNLCYFLRSLFPPYPNTLYFLWLSLAYQGSGRSCRAMRCGRNLVR